MSEPTPRLAILGDADPTAVVRSAVSAADARLADPAEADGIVAVGDAALREAMRAVASGEVRSVPILPIGDGRHALDPESATELLADVVDGLGASPAAIDGFSRVAHPVLSVEAGSDDTGPLAAADVAFVTAEPARISEYGIAFSDGDEVSMRADGAVVATPLGSGGYAAAAGGPVVSPGGGLSVVPISPFTTRPDTWVASDGLRVTVKRGEEPVALVVDGVRSGTIAPHCPVRIETAATVELLAPTAE
ncbi:ATP-NAD kinase [Halorubrum sp. RMP-47]|uniref:ATP-NAD kinase n=1 Tax=Halorubrum miltondacostae TaxID=3076378 RepID=A0ABD5M3J0_9EURY